LEWMTAVTTPVPRSPILETMKRTTKHVAPWLAAAAIGGALVFAPVASADSSADPGPHAAPSQSQPAPPAQSGADPQVPYGTNSDSNLPYDDAGNVFEQGGAV
jgi:hypothetical protein